MPYGPVKQSQRRKALTDEQHARKVREIQAEQERRLRDALGDELYDCLEAFGDDLNVLGQN